MKLQLKRYIFTLAIAAALLLLIGGAWAMFKPSAQPAAGVSGPAPKTAKSPAGPAGVNPSPETVTPAIPDPASQALSRRVAEYHLNARLDAEEGKLTASGSVTWTHPGSLPVSDLYFHLYPNAFESENTTFMKESGGQLRGDVMPDNGFGSMTLTEVTTTGGVSLLHRMQYVQPDDGNPEDRTLIKIHLPEPLHGGESVTLNLKYEVRLPKVFARMGSAGEFVMAGQWYPKLSVYETPSWHGARQEGWNLHQYHGNSEFYADFGIYSVSVTVPEPYIVAATGFPVKTPRQNDGWKTYQFYADDVHDFAWAASPDFTVAEEAFSAPGVPGVRIKLYLDPLHSGLQQRYFDAAKAALTRFSDWYGPYPYSTLSVVVPPSGAPGAGGMEYPTLVTAFAAESAEPDLSLERTVIHEIAHQYFYGILANNEFEEAWLDESFASYAEDKLMELEYGVPSNLSLTASFVRKPMPLKLEAWRYGGDDAYTQNVYLRGKLLLKDIERQVGAETMDRILSVYTSKYRFRHPTTAAFQQTVENVTKRSWKPYFDSYVYQGGAPDFAIAEISNAAREGGGYESLVTAVNTGSDYDGVDLKFTFADGHVVTHVWKGGGETKQFRLKYDQPVVSAEINPDRAVLLEHKHFNNFRQAEIGRETAYRWTLGAAQLIETLLGILSW